MELRHQLETLARQVLATPHDSPEWKALDEQIHERLELVLALRGELEN